MHGITHDNDKSNSRYKKKREKKLKKHFFSEIPSHMTQMWFVGSYANYNSVFRGDTELRSLSAWRAVFSSLNKSQPGKISLNKSSNWSQHASGSLLRILPYHSTKMFFSLRNRCLSRHVHFDVTPPNLTTELPQPTASSLISLVCGHT